MQTEKFTIFDFDKLQDPSKREQYLTIANQAKKLKLQYTTYEDNYVFGLHRVSYINIQ